MLAWLLALLCLFSADLASEAPGLGTPRTPGEDSVALGGAAPACPVNEAVELMTVASMPEEMLLVILAELEAYDLYHVFFVSKSFQKCASTALENPKPYRQSFPNYTRLAYMHNALMQSESREHGAVEATTALTEHPIRMHIRRKLMAEFGYCIKLAKGGSPIFAMSDVSFEILNDVYRISVLPYAIDQLQCRYTWINFIRELAELGRVDLLDQLRFPQISRADYDLLRSVVLPESTVLTAARRLRANGYGSELELLLSLAGTESELDLMPSDFRLPVYFVRNLHKKGVAIPETWVFVDGLEERSFSFWLHISQTDGKTADKLVQLAIKHGDDNVRRMASLFSSSVRFPIFPDAQEDIYQAVLIRFRYSHNCTPAVVQNYRKMLTTMTTTELYTRTLEALIDCRQFDLVFRYAFQSFPLENLAAYIFRLCQLKDSTFDPIVGRCVRLYSNAPHLLKRLLWERADEAQVQLVWASMQAKATRLHCCSAPLNVLKKLMLEQNVPIDDVRRMLSPLEGFQEGDSFVSKEVHILGTLMFWEASEEAISYFLDLIPTAEKFIYSSFVEFLKSTKYSIGLCKKLLGRLGLLGLGMQELLEFRLDLAKFDLDD